MMEVMERKSKKVTLRTMLIVTGIISVAIVTVVSILIRGFLKK